MAMQQSFGSKTNQKRRSLIFERLMALVALLNLGVVLFDLSYIPGRDVYYKVLPQITKHYDPVKGIEPNIETQQYLQAVDQLQEEIKFSPIFCKVSYPCQDSCTEDSDFVLCPETDVVLTPVTLKQTQVTTTESQLIQLRQLSLEMIENNPFASADKSENLEQIKNIMRRHLQTESARQAFQTFWSQAHLNEKGWQEELTFFNREVRPLIAVNYFRWSGPHGLPLNYFWLIDLPFILLFSIEFLTRTWMLARRHPLKTRFQMMLWRWYDLPLCLPFLRWLRIIPVVMRLHQAQWIHLQSVQAEIDQWIVVQTAAPLAKIIGLQLIEQIQELIRSEDFAQWIAEVQASTSVEHRNHVDSLAMTVAKLSIQDILPQIQTDVTQILHHSVTSVLNQSPYYQRLCQLPGVTQHCDRLLEQLLSQVTQIISQGLAAAVDPVGEKFAYQLIQHTGAAIDASMSQAHIQETIRGQMIAWLEAVKVDYLQETTYVQIEHLAIKAQESPQPVVIVES